MGEGADEPDVNTPGADDPGPVGESGWSADQRAKELRARGGSSAGAGEGGGRRGAGGRPRAAAPCPRLRPLSHLTPPARVSVQMSVGARSYKKHSID